MKFRSTRNRKQSCRWLTSRLAKTPNFARAGPYSRHFHCNEESGNSFGKCQTYSMTGNDNHGESFMVKIKRTAVRYC